MPSENDPEESRRQFTDRGVAQIGPGTDYVPGAVLTAQPTPSSGLCRGEMI